MVGLFKLPSGTVALRSWLLAAGVGLGLPAAAPAAAATLAARCAELPPSRFEVVAVPLTWAEGETLGIDELTVRGGHQPGVRMTFGLTTASFGARTRNLIHTVEDPPAAWACATVEAQVELSMQPVIVQLAQELEVSRCARDATLEHELQHVAVFRDVLAEAARELAAELPDAIGRSPQHGPSAAELQQRLGTRVGDYVRDFVTRRSRELERRQALVDSPPEYARVRAACPQ